MNFKKSQITIFILLGIVLVMVFGFLFYLSDNPVSKKEPTNLDTLAIDHFVNNCMEQTIQQCISFVGTSDDIKLEKCFDSNLPTCTNNFRSFNQYIITEGTIVSDITFSQDQRRLIINLDYPLTIVSGDSKKEKNDFYISYNIMSNVFISSNQDTSLSSVDKSTTLLIPNETEALNADGTNLDQIFIMVTDISNHAGNNLQPIAYDLLPDGATFDPSIELSIIYNELYLPNNVDESELNISYHDGTNWISLPTTRDTVNNVLTAYIYHFTPYSITYEDGADEPKNYSAKEWFTLDKSSRSTGEGPTSCGTSSSNYGDGWNFPERICNADSSTATHKSSYSEHYIGVIPSIPDGDEVENIGNVTIEVAFNEQPGSGSAGIILDTDEYVSNIDLASSPSSVDISDQKEWSYDDFRNSKLVFHTYLTDFRADNIQLIVSEDKGRVKIDGDIITVELPRYCEVSNYKLKLDEVNSLNVSFFNETSLSNLFTINTASYSCSSGYYLIGGYDVNGSFTETLRRHLSCDLDMLTTPRYESDEIRDCLNRGICDVDFSQRCQNNIWVGCNYPEEYSTTESCDGLDNNCDGSLGNNENLESTGTEICNGKDDNCNGEVDEGLDCHLPVLTGGERFLYKPETSLVLLPVRMDPHGGSNPGDHIFAAHDPQGTQIICDLGYSYGYHGDRPKWRFDHRGTGNCVESDLKSKNNFYLVVTFKNSQLKQPYLIHDGSRRQE